MTLVTVEYQVWRVCN